MRFTVAMAVGCLIAGVAIADSAHAAVRKSTSIPPQDLKSALQRLAADRDFQILYRTEVVGDRRTDGATGELDMDETLTRLLNGTGLSYQYLDDKTITILPPPTEGRPQSTAAARVTAAGTEAAKGGQKRSFWDRFRLARVDQGTTEHVASVADASETGSKSSAVEEVVVTAQKRIERVRDVPASIAVVTADEISRRGLVNSEDYLRGLPGVNQSEAVPNGQAIIIRGLETTVSAQNYFAGPTTATYFGETPTTSSAGLNASNVDLKLIDIERVEVLRGPQGTAFGSSSMGGAVRTIPVAPKLNTFEGAVAADYSVTGGAGGANNSFQAIGNIPLINDRLALRAVAYRSEDQGYYKNRAGSNANFQASYIIPNHLQDFAVDQDEVGDYRVKGGRVAALYQATDNLKFTLSYLTQTTETDGFPIQTSGEFEQTLLSVAPEHVRRGQTSGYNDFRLHFTNAMAEYDLGWADLLGTYSRIRGNALTAAPYGQDGLFSLDWAASAFRDFPHRDDVGEIRLVSKLQGPWNFLAGAYKEKQYNAEALDITWFGDQALNPFGQRNGILTDFDERQLRQDALFTEVSWRFLPKLTLTGGARHYRYDRAHREDQAGPLVGGGTTTSRERSEESGNIFRANLSYKPEPDTLLYASWAQGFRLGQPLAPVPAGLCDVAPPDGLIDGTNTSIASTASLKSDSVNSYELGTKFTAAERRVSVEASLFRMEWKDIPVSEILACKWNHFFNAGSARSQGLELQTAIRLTEALRADIGGSYIDAHLTQDVPAQGYHSGDRLPGAPKWNGTLGLQYQFKVLGRPAFVRGDAMYVGPFYNNVIQSPAGLAGDYVKVDAKARVIIDALNIDLYVRNLTDEDAYTNRPQMSAGVISSVKGYRMRPRTIGFQLGYNF